MDVNEFLRIMAHFLFRCFKVTLNVKKTLARKPFHFYIAVLSFFLIFLACSSMLALSYKASLQTNIKYQQQLFIQFSNVFGKNVQLQFLPSLHILKQQRYSPIQHAEDWPERHPYIQQMVAALEVNPSLQGVFVGYKNGEFFEVSRKYDEKELKIDIPSSTEWMVWESTANGQVSRIIFLNKKLDEVGRSDGHLEQFDPRNRPWYELANQQTENKFSVTEPYLFWGSGVPGITVSIKSSSGNSIFGVDISLNSFNEKLSEIPHLSEGRVLVLDKNNKILSQSETLQNQEKVELLTSISESKHPLLMMLSKNMPTTSSEGGVVQFESENSTLGRWFFYISQPSVETNYKLVVAIPRSAIVANASKEAKASFGLLVAILLISMPIITWIAYLSSSSLRKLQQEADRLNRFDFNSPLLQGSIILEVDNLIQAINRTKQTLSNFVSLGENMAKAQDINSLYEHMLLESSKAVQAYAALLYVKEGDDYRPVKSCWAGNITHADDMPPLMDDTGSKLKNIWNGKTVTFSIDEQYWDNNVGHYAPYPGNNVVIVLPLHDHMHGCVGVMLFILPHLEQDQLDSRIKLMESLSGNAASAMTAQQLISKQKFLIDSFIELIAGAIDAKSPYTGGHCLRVPELTHQLAVAASQMQSGPFAHFKPDENEWEAIRIAGWLHDCGKITTPEYVVDKATKLETIYDRIHEIRTRFEVLKRDAQIELLQRQVSAQEQKALQTELKSIWDQLDKEFAFIARCNTGENYTSPEDVATLAKIAARQWTRTIDNRQGLSHEEQARTPVSQLPCQESLLKDGPEHIIPHHKMIDLADEKNYGIKMTVPEHLYHRGEFYNLSIPRGTLTNEERYKVNEHIIQTIKILERLPFPEHLASVPEIASGHHERMDGNGYPRKLTKEQLSIPARIIAIADIFEALTASDRPYKHAKTISESLRIMKGMAINGHIDPDLYDLFIRSDIWYHYGKKFLNPKQLDSVDINELLLTTDQSA